MCMVSFLQDLVIFSTSGMAMKSIINLIEKFVKTFLTVAMWPFLWSVPSYPAGGSVILLLSLRLGLFRNVLAGYEKI